MPSDLQQDASPSNGSAVTETGKQAEKEEVKAYFLSLIHI